MGLRARDAAVPRTSPASIAWTGLLTGRIDQAGFADAPRTGTPKVPGRWTEARRATGRASGFRLGCRPGSGSRATGKCSPAPQNRPASDGSPDAALRHCRQSNKVTAVLLVAVAALLALPLQAQAQTTDVSNLNETQAVSLSVTDRQAQTFTTGAHAGGYALSSVDVMFRTSGTVAASIYSTTGSDPYPDSELDSLTPPGTFNSGSVSAHTFTAPANTTLARNTTYAVVIAPSGGGGSTSIGRTDSDAESGITTNWGIGDAYHQPQGGSLPWRQVSNERSLLIAVTGAGAVTPNSNPVFADTTLMRSVAGNAAPGTGIGAVIPAATDADTGDTLTYSLEGTEAASFDFDASTRQIKTLVALDSQPTADVAVTVKAGICGRTAAVRTAILNKISGVSNCANVTDAHLAAITGTLDLEDKGITALAAGDFDGLTALTHLNLNHNSLATLPAGVFDELTALERLNLYGNSLTTLRAGVFDELTALAVLGLSANSLSTLPDDVFEELTSLGLLQLGGNPGAPFSPTANALPDDGEVLVGPGSTVTLDGSGSDGGPWGTNVTYSWAASGATVTFDDNRSATPVVTIPALADGTELTFTLTVTGRGAHVGTAPDTDTATVTAVFDSTLGICGRTEAVRDGIVALVSGVINCAFVTDAHLGAITGTLDLHNKGITALAAGDFDGLTALTRLWLDSRVTALGGVDYNDLTTLSAGVFDELTALESLNLELNDLTTLRAGVFDGLTSLEYLNLSYNDLTTLRAGVFDELTALERLNLELNDLTTLRAGVFDELTALTTLELDYNDLTTLPAGVFEELTALTRLELQSNPGAPFSPTADALPDDGTVPASGGTVTLDGSGSDGGPWGTNVTYSWAASGAAVTFDDAASATPVVTIPALADGTELTFTLTVTGRATDTSYGSAPDTDTATVTVAFDSTLGICGRTEQVRDAIVALVSGVTSCALVTDAHLAAITGTLRLGAENITALAVGDFDGLPALESLLLNGNSLSTLPAGVFDELTALTQLSLFNNSLSTLPAGVFDKLTSLTTLRLYTNSLSTLPAGVFDELTALTTLRLDNNSLSTLPAGVFEPLTALTTLRLDDNSLSTLPAGAFEELTALTTLQLQGNPGAPFSPTADALPDDGEVSNAGGTVTLDGSGSDGGPWGTNVTYSWAASGAAVTFDDAASATPVVTIPALAAGTELTFTLTVTGRGGTNGIAPGTDTAKVTVFGGICGRTEAVRNAILDRISGVSNCALVTDAHLAAITGTLYLVRDGITALAAGDFAGLTELKNLDLRDNELTTLPTGVFAGLTALRDLYLDDNELTTLPTGVFAGLTALGVLRLPDNGLTTLPTGVFAGLTTLRDLYLHNNELSTLPDDVFEPLTALTRLYLNSNELTALPAGVFAGLTSLEYLELPDNGLTTLDAGVFDGLTLLISLVLSDNELATLPDDVFEPLIRLLRLNLSNNSGEPFAPTADALPDDGTFLNAGGTVTLDGSGSDGGPWGTNVTYSWALTDPASGVTVMFDDTAIATPEVTIPALTPVTDLTFTLTVTGRGGTVGIDPATDTATVTAVFDPTAGICGRTEAVRNAILGGISGINNCAAVTAAHLAAITGSLGLQNITSLAAGDFDGLTSLTLVFLEFNELTTLPAGVFDGLTSLQYLGLGNNELSTLPAGVFDGLTSLTELSLHYNELTELPAGVFDGLTSLTTLDLGRNSLATLPAGVFDELTALTELHLTNNELATLPAGVFDELTALTTLGLQDNLGAPFSPTADALPDDGTVLDAGGDVTLDGSGSDGGPWGTNVTYSWAASGAAVTFDDAASATPVVTIPALAEGTELTFTLTVTGRATDTSYGSAPDTDTAMVTAEFDATAGICGRTEQVRDAIVALVSGVTHCALVTDAHLAAITGNLLLNSKGITALAAGDFNGLTALTNLNLRDNSLSTLPAGVFEPLTALTNLNLRDNSLSTLPAGVFDELTALTNLNLWGNSLSTLPAGVFGELTALTTLGLRNNSLSTLPAGVFAGLTALEELELQYNSLSTLPAGVFEPLTALTTLRLQDNPGAPFSPTADALPDDGTVLDAGGDVTLDGSGSDGGPWGTNVTYSWAASGATVTFDDAASATPVVTIPALAEGTELTFTLTVTGRATHASRGSAPATDTATVTAEFDATAGICGRTKEVRDAIVALVSGVTACADVTDAHLAAITGTLILFNDGITALAAGDFDELTALTKLELHRNSLSTLPAGVFDELTALTTLVLYDNSLSTLPAGVFDGLTALLKLELQRNSLSTLPAGVFDKLTALTKLQLHNNSLTTLPDGVFEELTALTQLDLQGNLGAPFAPTAVALPDDGTVSFAGGDVTLDGSGSDGGPWGTNVTYSWALTSPASGVTVTFDDAAIATPVVTIPALTDGTELTFTLTVTGRGGNTGTAPDTDTATVTAEFDSTAGICGRTEQVRDQIVFQISGVSNCADVTDAHLAAITVLVTNSDGITALAAGDFDELTALTELDLGGNSLETLPAGVFDELTALTELLLHANDFTELPAGVFDKLTALTELHLSQNSLETLPAGVFDELTDLEILGLWGNSLTTLPDDVFEELTSLTTLTLQGNPVSFGPTANALPDDGTVLDAGGDVTLDGSGSDGGPWGTNVTYSWVASGATVTFDDAASATPVVTIPALAAGTELTFTLTVTPRGRIGIGVNTDTDTATVTVQTAGVLVLNVDAITTDNTINIAEKAAGFRISGDTGSEGGVSVTVTVGTTELTAISADTDPATWSVSVASGGSYITGTSVDVTVSATKTGYTAPAAITRSLAVDLAAPTAPGYSAPASLKVGEAITSMNPSGGIDIAEYGAAGLPPGLGIDPTSGVIGGTPEAAGANTATATITVSDAAGNTATATIIFPAVDKGDQALTGFRYSPSSVTYGSGTVPSVTAPTGVLTTLSYSASPADVCAVEPTSGALTLAGAGVCEITATAAGSDDYNEETVGYTVTVQAAGALVLNVSAIAGDNRINIAEHTAGFDIGGDTGTESGVDVTVDIGGVTLTATSAEVAGTATWSVSVPASAPYITGTSLDVEVNASKTGYTAPAAITRSLAVDLTAPTAPGYSAPASLKVGEAITSMNPSGGVDIAEYGAAGLPPGLVIDAGGVIGGTPDAAEANTATATITVSDAAGNTATATIIFPAVDKGDQALTGFRYSPSSVTYGSGTVPSVTAPTGARASLSYTATPAGVCGVDPSTGALTLVGAGVCEITATAAGSDDYNEATVGYTVTVQAAGALALNLGVIAGDGTVNIAEKGAGFEIGGDTGTEAGVGVTVGIGGETLTTTSADDAGTATWTVGVPADAAYISGASVAVEVNASKTGYTAPAAIRRSLAVDLTAPTAPGYSAPASLKVGEAITSMNPSGGVDIAEYGAAGLPAGLVIDPTSGVIGGTPEAADAATATATVTVGDAAGNTATVDITFPAVDRGDQALTGFRYSPSSVTYGSGTVPSVTAPTGVLTTLSYSASPADVCAVEPTSGALTLVGAGVCEITATAAGSDDYNEATVGYTVTVQAAGALALNLGVIAGDGTVNIAEKAAGFEIGGDTGTEAGVGVTVGIGGETLTTTSADDAGTATWTVSVPADASYITGTSLVVEVNASKTGYTAPAAITRSLAVDLTAPTAPGYSAPASLKVGEAITSMNPSGGIDVAEYSATDLPSGLTLNTGTGVIGGTPDTADASTATATVTVGDAAGNTATATIIFPAVDRGDQALTGFRYSPSSVTYGSGTVPSVTAPTGVLTTLSYLATPADVCTVDPTSGALTLAGAGVCEITATAAGSDDYNEATVGYTVTVQAAGALALNLDAIAGDGTVNIAEKAAGFEIGGDTGTEAGVGVTVGIGGETLTTTSADDAGTATWTVSVPADAAYISGASVAVEVNASKTGYTAPAAIRRSLAVDLAAPTAPGYSAPASLKVGEAITSMNPSGGIDIAEYGAADLPPGLGIDPTSGVIGGTPEAAEANTATATITVSDAAGNTATATIIFPAVDRGDQALTGFRYSPSSVTYGSGTVPSVTAPTGARTSLSYTATPAGVCGVDPSTGALTLAGAGVCEITATAAGSDDYNEATVGYTVTVQAAGALALNLDAIAGDGTVNIAEKAAGFEIGGDTGTEAGVGVTVGIGGETLTTTSADDAGTATWTVSVPADAAYISGASVAVEVNASKTGYTAPAAIRRSLAVDLTAPTAPGYSAPASLKVGEAITSMNPSGGIDIAEYGAADLPPGLGIDPTSGVIGGTPEAADAATATATVTVSDASGNTATTPITFPPVAKGDQALVGFEYSASSVAFGSAAPTVTAPGGVQTTLSYSATPSAVCAVDPFSGALTLAGVGGCVITATAADTDNYNETTATFTVTVQADGTLVLNLDRITGDDTINIAEKAAGFGIGGDTGSEAGASVTVAIGTGSLSATSADDNGTATWSVSVPADASYITGANLVVEVNATKTGFTSPAAITRTLTVDPTAPTAPGYSAPSSLQVGGAISPMNPSGGSGIDEYRSTALPSGLEIDTGSGVISGTPDTADSSTATAEVTVSDAAGNTAGVSITFPAVAKGDQALSGFAYGASLVKYGAAAPSVTAPEGARTSLNYSATPAEVCRVDPSTGALTLLNAGICEIVATAAASANYNLGIATYTVTVREAETVLTLKVSPAAVEEHGGGTSVTVTGTLDRVTRDAPTTFTLGVGASDDAATEGSDYAAVGDLTLTVPSGQASGTATFTLTTIDDFIDEPDEALSITAASRVAGFEVLGTTLAITDNDERGVRISPTSLAVPEGGGESYTVVLTSQPSGEVTVTPSLASGDTDVTVGEALTFDETTWDQAQTVTVSAGQDADATNDTAMIAHAISGADYGEGGVTADDVSVTVDDDETALTLTVNPAAVDEHGGDTSVTVTGTLDGVTRDEPTTLTVNMGASDDAAVKGTDYTAVSDLALTIPSGQASGAATFTLTAIDDFLDERVEAVSITGTIEDAGFEVIGTTLSITDNDERGVRFSPSSLSVPEGGDATYTVVLTSRPSGEVTVTPSLASNDTDVTAGAALTFTEATWDQARTVTVSAAHDADAANDTATIVHSISGADYEANKVTAGDVSVTVDDDETALTLTVSPASLDEHRRGAVVTVTAALDGATRDAPTTLTLSVGAADDAATEGTDYAMVSDLILKIPSGESSGKVSFRFATIEDFIDEPDEALSITARSRNAGFEVIGTTLSIIDNDERGVQISPTSLTLPEGGNESYRVVLTSQPTGEVTVTPSLGSGDSDVTVGAALRFDATTWDQAQPVTVSAARDTDATNDTATIQHLVSGADYGANGVTPADVSVTVEDDGTAVTLTVNPAVVDEDAQAITATVTATLDGVTRDAPTTLTLSVGASGDAATEGTDYAAVNDLSLTIPTGRASGTATFTLTTMDDLIDEPDEAVSINGTIQDAGFEVIGTTLAITDNDERGVTVSPTDLTLAEGAGATYTLVLDTEPTETVTVTPSVSGSPDLTFTPSSLTFTSSDWDTAQTVNVSANEDDDAYHDSSIVSHVAQGAGYASLVDGEISVTISDNEVASDDTLPAQVTDVSATASATHVDLAWSAVPDTVLGYRVEASYDGGANWAEVEDNTESTDSTETIETSHRHDAGLNFAETRRYRVSAEGGNGAGLPSAILRASATATTGGLTATVAMPRGAAEPVPAIDLCWIPEGVAASELGGIALAMSPVYSSGADDLSDLPWQSAGSGSSEVDCEDGIGVRLTSISENQRYAFRMRASHAGAWLVSNDAQAVLVDSSKPLRTVVTAGASGLSGDTPVPDLVCRDYDDPATREDDAGSFLLSIGFTTASAEYLRYEPVNDFDPASDLTLVNATAELLDRPYDIRLGYRVRITPSVWGEPVLVSVPADVVTHGEMSAGNQASAEFRRETTDAVDCDTASPEPAHRSQVVAVAIEADGDRNGEWTAGEPIRVTLQFDEPVRVTTTDGIPGVTLTLGEAGTMGQTPDGEAATDATEQSSDGEAAVDVTLPFSLVAHEDTLVFEHMVTADQSPVRDVALLADSLSLNGGRIDSFSGPAVGLAHAGAGVVGGPNAQPDLTAGWSMIPGAHEGGESHFEIHLRFSEDVDPIRVIGEQNLIEHAFTVTGGAIEAIRPARDRRGEYLTNEWAMRVVPASEEPVTVSLVVDLACDQPGAICTIDDRSLTEAPSVTVHRVEQALSVADAEVGEGPGAVLVFEVTLARAADEPVTVDYETADGTATAGEDYEAVSGTLGIEAGQTTASVRVNIIDDSHDEGEETLTLVLTSASNARIHDGEALGIIVNSDPIPSAWLARFGRAASDHVAQAVARRLERGPSEEHMTLGGLRLDRLFTSFADPDAGGAASASMHMDPDSLESGAMQPPLAWSATGSGYRNAQPAAGLGTGTISSGPTGGFGAQGPTGGSDAQWSSGGMAAPHARAPRGSDTLPSLRDALLGSSFFYTHGESDDATSSPLTAWGETASTRFKGSEGALSLDGEVTTAMLGLDKRYGRWLVGSTLSYSEGQGGYQGSGALGGSMQSTLTSLNPYVHFEVNETTSLWGVFGYGSGSLRVTPQGARSALETDLTNRMAAFGGRGRLSVGSGDAGRFELALRSDALVTRTDSDAVHGLAGAHGATSRVRLMLEGSGSMPLSTGGVLKPSLEAGLRYDGGDAETGAGIELGGGLGYAAGNLSVEVNARALVAHEDTGYQEWGFSGSLAYTPGRDGRGLSMKLGSAWGSTQSGVQSLWSRQDASGLAGTSPFEAAQRFQAELGYGIAGRREDALWVPFIAARAADGDGQALQMGVRLASESSLEAELRLGRRQDLQGVPKHAVELRASMRW